MFQSVLERQVGDVEAALLAAVRAIDPDLVPASEATRLFERLDRIARAAHGAGPPHGRLLGLAAPGVPVP